jgi:hypothetical protein
VLNYNFYGDFIHPSFFYDDLQLKKSWLDQIGKCNSDLCSFTCLFYILTILKVENVLFKCINYDNMYVLKIDINFSSNSLNGNAYYIAFYQHYIMLCVFFYRDHCTVPQRFLL